MFDSVSWGELLVIGGVGVIMTGRKDLPTAARFLGTQLGRIVGLLQGARLKADQFAHQNELRQLQNEFRSSLRELDKVKMELAMAASTQGVVGKTPAAITASVNKREDGRVGYFAGGINNSFSAASSFASNTTTNISSAAATSFASPLPTSIPRDTSNTQTQSLVPGTASLSGGQNNNLSMDMFDFQVEDENDKKETNPYDHDDTRTVSPSERAVLEEEWHKQGIGYKSVAESGQWDFEGKDTSKATGSELLEYLTRQSLIFDQYDQAMASQNQSLQEKILARRQQQQLQQPQTERKEK
jgi:Sec-independent protein translocase protein TatA